MKSSEFPLIISPNLGCPEIISVEQIKRRKTKIPIIIADQYGEFSSPLKDIFEGVFFLRPSEGGFGEIPLHIVDGPYEIVGWNQLSEFSDIHATREIINSELHYNIFGEETRYWKINVSTGGIYRSLLRRKGYKSLPTLFDLVLTDKSKKWERVNYHSVQFVKSFKEELNFIHLTDLHAAKRNDEILDEVLKVKGERGRKEIEKSYINFNDKFREFIGIANDMADKGELDFVVITGDLVDFAFHGWDDESNSAENNWKTFINIVIGAGKEKLKGNPGIKVAIFTSTGNHDWRLHPYDPKWGKYKDKLGKFGLEKEELKNYDYRSFDSREFPEDKRAKQSKEIAKKAFGKLNTGGLTFFDRGKLKLEKWLSKKVLFILTSLGLVGAAGVVRYTKFINLWIPLLFELIVWTVKIWVHRLVDFIVDNPLHAEARALHYYLKHINPYLDYAFQYGDHSFIVMDTGADVFVGQLLDGKKIKDIKKMSIEDNIIGGSPDSTAFDSEQSYYNWSQIVWLEKVLSITNSMDKQIKGRTLVFLHAPPINSKDGKDFNWENFWERTRSKSGKTKWIPEEECNLTYGTINHYLSQFFYLCMGFRESELIAEKVEPSVSNVNLVFSGHAHRNIEFRIEKEWVWQDKKHWIRIFSDVYSQLLDAEALDRWWQEHSPVVVQTAACGLQGSADIAPPYFRKVTIDNKGQITDFRVRNKDGIISFE